MRYKLHIIACVFAAWSSGVDAQECPDRAGHGNLNQLEMTRCAAELLYEAEDELDAVYHQIKLRIETWPAFLGMLEASQSSWVAYRDAQCLFALGPSTGGSSHNWAKVTCKEPLTRLRIEELKQFLSCENASFLCSVPLEPLR